jgi:two-component system response regulator YesN
MEAHFSEKISLSDISRRAGMSEKYFCRLFREQTGDTFVGALTVIRIRAAEKMLSQTNLRTYEIAEQAGFGDYHHFCKTFKRLTGKTPTEFRTG